MKKLFGFLTALVACACTASANVTSVTKYLGAPSPSPTIIFDQMPSADDARVFFTVQSEDGYGQHFVLDSRLFVDGKRTGDLVFMQHGESLLYRLREDLRLAQLGKLRLLAVHTFDGQSDRLAGVDYKLVAALQVGTTEFTSSVVDVPRIEMLDGGLLYSGFISVSVYGPVVDHFAIPIGPDGRLHEPYDSVYMAMLYALTGEAAVSTVEGHRDLRAGDFSYRVIDRLLLKPIEK